MAKADTDEFLGARDFRTVRERLRRAALALTRDPQDADDLTQQTMLTLLSKHPDRLGHAGYARRTLVRLWLDEQRSVRRRMRRLAHWMRVTATYHFDVDHAAATETRTELHAAIDALPPKQHAVLVLRLVEGLDYAAIAEALDCSVEAVRATLHVARQKLRDTIGEPS